MKATVLLLLPWIAASTNGVGFLCMRVQLLPSPTLSILLVPVLLGSYPLGVMWVKFVAQGNTTNGVALHFPTNMAGSTGTMLVKFLAQGIINN